jgi:SAM-dependent methyltransferase
MRHSGNIEEYYARRAEEYERIYAMPERQSDLKQLREVLVAFGAGRRLLEIACGTGYWTEAVACDAALVVATDAVEEVLAVARDKGLPANRVTFLCADAFKLDMVPGDFDGAFAGFWWSHLARADLAAFLIHLHRHLGPGRQMLFFDNKFVAGSSTPISRRDRPGNSYQQRVLSDGTTHEILKNFPSTLEIRRQILDTGGRAVQVRELQYYWYARYEIGRTREKGR